MPEIAVDMHCVGVNHRTSRIQVREKLVFSDEEARMWLASIGRSLFKECVLISTCNRTELYYVPLDRGTDAAVAWNSILTFRNAAGLAGVEDYYILSSLKAANHLFRVASGMDSMVLGDVQILHQIKTAFAASQESGCVGSILNKLFSQALHVGKRARTETEIGDGAVSVGYAAAELASKIFSGLLSKTALLIGAGETATLAARHFQAGGLGRLIIANRTASRAEALGGELGGATVPFADIANVLSDADIVISSVASPGVILTRDDICSAMARRDHRPLLLIDLGVPRNIEPLSGGPPGVFLHDVDSLNNVVTRNIARRLAELPKLRRIVHDELLQFHDWHRSLSVNPTIQDLRERFEEIRLAELRKCSHRFSPEMQEEVAIVTRQIVNKILHPPMVHLRERPRRDNISRSIQLVRSLFALDRDSLREHVGSPS